MAEEGIPTPLTLKGLTLSASLRWFKSAMRGILFRVLFFLKV
jgi:hypothetical protein